MADEPLRMTPRGNAILDRIEALRIACHRVPPSHAGLTDERILVQTMADELDALQADLYAKLSLDVSLPTAAPLPNVLSGTMRPPTEVLVPYSFGDMAEYIGRYVKGMGSNAIQAAGEDGVWFQDPNSTLNVPGEFMTYEFLANYRWVYSDRPCGLVKERA